jgi:hypothetical protein
VNKTAVISLGADLYDHRHDWNTQRQDTAKARNVIFVVEKRAKKYELTTKMFKPTLGVLGYEVTKQVQSALGSPTQVTSDQNRDS